MTGIRVGVIGAGPAGIMAALEAAALGAQVSLYDTNPMVGRKLLVTGNGRCNISNLEARPERYITDDPDALARILARCGPETTLRRLEELGIPTYATDDGWCYPLSDSAATVADTLAAALDLAGVRVHLQTMVSDVRPGNGGLPLIIGGQTQRVDRVVVATGGKAHPALGSKGQFFAVLEALGHTVLPIMPALTAIECDMRPVRDLQGVRMDVGLSLYDGPDMLASTVGNLMFTKTGLSGPAPMDLSYLVSSNAGRHLAVRIDLLAMHRDALQALVGRYRDQPLPLRVALGAVLPAKIPPVMLALAGIGLERTLAGTTDAEWERLWDVLGALELRIRDVRGFQFAQLSTGGVPLAEVNPHTLGSDRVPGLHLAGEVLNVIGPCGGHNLQFAWATGMLAGRGAAR